MNDATMGWPGDDAGVLDRVVGHYRSALPGSSAFGWLERRGLMDGAAIGKFRIGFSDRTLGRSLPAKQSDPDEIRPRLQRLGVLRNSGHEHFRGCVTFPVIDAAGEVVEVYGRTVGKDTRLEAGRHRWLTGTPAGVWNVDDLDRQRDKNWDQVTRLQEQIKALKRDQPARRSASEPVRFDNPDDAAEAAFETGAGARQGGPGHADCDAEIARLEAALDASERHNADLKTIAAKLDGARNSKPTPPGQPTMSRAQRREAERQAKRRQRRS